MDSSYAPVEEKEYRSLPAYHCFRSLCDYIVIKVNAPLSEPGRDVAVCSEVPDDIVSPIASVSALRSSMSF